MGLLGCTGGGFVLLDSAQTPYTNLIPSAADTGDNHLHHFPDTTPNNPNGLHL